jgi:hypothetical protein
MLRLFLLASLALTVPAFAATVGDESAKNLPEAEIAEVLRIMAAQESLSPDVVLTHLTRANTETPIYCGMARTADLPAAVPFAADVKGETALILLPTLVGDPRDDVQAAIASLGCPVS